MFVNEGGETFLFVRVSEQHFARVNWFLHDKSKSTLIADCDHFERKGKEKGKEKEKRKMMVIMFCGKNDGAFSIKKNSKKKKRKPNTIRSEFSGISLVSDDFSADVLVVVNTVLQLLVVNVLPVLLHGKKKFVVVLGIDEALSALLGEFVSLLAEIEIGRARWVSDDIDTKFSEALDNLFVSFLLVVDDNAGGSFQSRKPFSRSENSESSCSSPGLAFVGSVQLLVLFGIRRVLATAASVDGRNDSFTFLVAFDGATNRKVGEGRDPAIAESNQEVNLLTFAVSTVVVGAWTALLGNVAAFADARTTRLINPDDTVEKLLGPTKAPVSGLDADLGVVLGDFRLLHTGSALEACFAKNIAFSAGARRNVLLSFLTFVSLLVDLLEDRLALSKEDGFGLLDVAKVVSESLDSCDLGGSGVNGRTTGTRMISEAFSVLPAINHFARCAETTSDERNRSVWIALAEVANENTLLDALDTFLVVSIKREVADSFVDVANVASTSGRGDSIVELITTNSFCDFSCRRTSVGAAGGRFLFGRTNHCVVWKKVCEKKSVVFLTGKRPESTGLPFF